MSISDYAHAIFSVQNIYVTPVEKCDSTTLCCCILNLALSQGFACITRSDAECRESNSACGIGKTRNESKRIDVRCGKDGVEKKMALFEPIRRPTDMIRQLLRRMIGVDVVMAVDEVRDRRGGLDTMSPNNARQELSTREPLRFELSALTHKKARREAGL